MLTVIKGQEGLIHNRLKDALVKDTVVKTTDRLLEEDLIWLTEEDLISSKKILYITINELKPDDELKKLLSEYKDAEDIIISIFKGSDNLKIMKWLKENANFKNADILNEEDFDAFLKEEIKAYNVSIPTELYGYLKEKLCYGTDEVNLFRVDIWLRMLSFFDVVTKKEIDDIIKVSGSQTAFDIIKAIDNGDKKTAIDALTGKKDDAIAILSVLQWAVRLSIKLKLFRAEEVGVTSWQLKNLKGFIGKDMARLDSAYKTLTDAILSIKKGIPPQSVLVRGVGSMFEVL